MARFRFSMQSILDVKYKLETQAKQAFAAAQAALNAQEEKLRALEARKASYEDRVRELLEGNLRVLEIEENQAAIKTMERYIEVQKAEVELARRKTERARADMADAMRERKTYETLREKAFDEFLMEENRAEGKTVDELVSYTYGQKKQT
ncbi:MAG: flagellar export protein FliJ [Lachnospiraceae bacterium]|nr:flagellar export protein FliJ [Lachnospiraceae bacterium]